MLQNFSRLCMLCGDYCVFAVRFVYLITHMFKSCPDISPAHHSHAVNLLAL